MQILIVTPVHFCKDNFLIGFVNSLNSLDATGYKVELLWVDNSIDNSYVNVLKKMDVKFSKKIIHVEFDYDTDIRERVTSAYGLARIFFEARGYDCICFIEEDCIVPIDFLNRIVTKIDDLHPIVSALIVDEVGRTNVGLQKRGRWSFLNELGGGGFKVYHACFCAVIMRKAEFLKSNIFWGDGLVPNCDMLFYDRCFELGIPVFVDSSVIVKHLQRFK